MNMVEFLQYDLKVAVLVAAFYMFYRLLLSRETFHRVNRAVLLLTAVASFLLPLCVVTVHKTVVLSQAPTGLVTADLGAASMAEPDMPLWQMLATCVFFAGVAVTLGRTLTSLCRLWWLIAHSEQHPQPDGTVVCVAKKEVSPFSWMHFIVLSHSDYEAHDAAVLAHERGHIRQRHTLDLLLVDTLTALQWFNPAMWMLRQDLRTIHEYEADAAVLSLGLNMRQYQYLLIQKAVGDCGYSVACGISHSTLKNRINMMLHKKSSPASLLKLLALLPIVGTALALNAETVNDYAYSGTPAQPQKKLVKKGRKAGTFRINGKTIEVYADKDTATGKKVTMEMNDDQLEPEITESVEQIVPDPLVVIDGKVATQEQLEVIDKMDIDNVSFIKDEETLKVFAEHFEADTSNGILFINTKEYVKNGKKAIATFTVQNDEPEKSTDREAFDVVEQMPEYPGGLVELMKYISMNVHYPEAAEKTGAQGRVLVQFVIEEDGSVSDAKVVQKVSDELDAEALRVVSAMPKWKPGRQKGELVRVKYTIPITFRLS